MNLVQAKEFQHIDIIVAPVFVTATLIGVLYLYSNTEKLVQRQYECVKLIFGKDNNPQHLLLLLLWCSLGHVVPRIPSLYGFNVTLLQPYGANDNDDHYCRINVQVSLIWCFIARFDMIRLKDSIILKNIKNQNHCISFSFITIMRYVWKACVFFDLLLILHFKSSLKHFNDRHVCEFEFNSLQAITVCLAWIIDGIMNGIIVYLIYNKINDNNNHSKLKLRLIACAVVVLILSIILASGYFFYRSETYLIIVWLFWFCCLYLQVCVYAYF